MFPSLFNIRDKSQDFFLIEHSLVRYSHTNICGSARIYRWKEICCEGSSGIEKRSYSFSLYFYMFHAMEYLDKIQKVLCFLIECLSPWIVMGRRNDPNGMIQHGEISDYNGYNRCRRE